MNETKQDLTRMLGVWAMRGQRLAFVASADPIHWGPLPLKGFRLAQPSQRWEPDGTFHGSKAVSEFDLTEKLGTLDDLRRGADVLMQRREYVTAAVVYQLLGDEEGGERAVAKRREQIEMDRQADEAKPF